MSPSEFWYTKQEGSIVAFIINKVNNDFVEAQKALRGLYIYKDIYSTIYALEKLCYYTFILFKVLNNLITHYCLVRENLFRVLIQVNNQFIKILTVDLIKCNSVLNNLLCQKLLKLAFVKAPMILIKLSLLGRCFVLYTGD